MERHPLAVRELDTRTLPIASLMLYVGNARQGDIGAIANSLQRLGQYRAVVVNAGTLTGREYEVLAGNHTVQAAQALGWETITAHVVDVDDDTARRIVLADNRTNDLATNDDAALLALLGLLDGDYAGTGYDGDDVDALIAALDPAPGEPGDADTDPVPDRYGVIVECDTEQQQAALLEQLAAEGFNVRAIM